MRPNTRLTVTTNRSIRSAVRMKETVAGQWWRAQSDTNRSPCYLANIRVISEKNSERITKSPRSARRPLVFHCLGKFENREKQGASIGVNREISLPIQVRKAEILFAAGCPLSMSVFEVRADKCAVHALVSV